METSWSILLVISRCHQSAGVAPLPRNQEICRHLLVLGGATPPALSVSTASLHVKDPPLSEQLLHAPISAAILILLQQRYSPGRARTQAYRMTVENCAKVYAESTYMAVEDGLSLCQVEGSGQVPFPQRDKPEGVAVGGKLPRESGTTRQARSMPEI